MRLLTPLLCALALLAGSVAAGWARGQAPAVGTQIHCLGGGLVAVPVDADGRPTGAARPCPDGVLALLVPPAADPAPRPAAAPPHPAEAARPGMRGGATPPFARPFVRGPPAAA